MLIKPPGSLYEALHFEDELLLCCARTNLNKETIDRVQSLVSKNIDWKYFFSNAIHHRVIPLVYRSLERVCRESVPSEILSRLQKCSQALAKRNLFLTAELLKLIKFLGVKGIVVIPYKGPSAAFLAYGNISLRQFNDLDILVRPNEYCETRRLLLSLGYKLTIDLDWECTLVNDKYGVCIDLHKGIAPQRYSICFDFDYLWAHLKTITPVGGRIRTLSVEDFLLILCIQMAKDSWGQTPLRLSKICDIAELLRFHPTINWTRVLKEATSLGYLRMLQVGLFCACNWLGAPIPELVSRSIAQKTLNPLTEHVLQELFFYSNDKHSARLPAQRFYALVRERWQDKYYPNYYDFKIRLLPNERDYSLIKLPEQLAFLYYGIRPIRLLKDWAIQGADLLKKGLFTWRD